MTLIKIDNTTLNSLDEKSSEGYDMGVIDLLRQARADIRVSAFSRNIPARTLLNPK